MPKFKEVVTVVSLGAHLRACSENLPWALDKWLVLCRYVFNKLGHRKINRFRFVPRNHCLRPCQAASRWYLLTAALLELFAFRSLHAAIWAALDNLSWRKWQMTTGLGNDICVN